jgi:glyoxylate carboligase
VTFFSKIVTHRQDDEERAKNTVVFASCTLSSTEGVLILIRLTEKSIYEMNLEVQICYDSLTSTKRQNKRRGVLILQIMTFVIDITLERETDCSMGFSIDAVREFEQ